MSFTRQISSVWSATDFNEDELTQYAEHHIEEDARKGVSTLSAVALLLLGTAATLYAVLGFGIAYVYTFSLLSLLSLHIAISSRFIKTTSVLHMLGAALLIIAGSALVLLAHKTGSFSPAILSSTVLLFMLVPLVPWGLREASLIIILIYLEFTLSIINVFHNFDSQTLWLLQFLMLGSAVTILTVVAQSVSIRKHNIKTRFELENAHRETTLVSFKDPLTGSWNRRYLDAEFLNIIAGYQKINKSYQFAIIDVDHFKEMNDTQGHIFGDCALKHLASLLLTKMKKNNYLFRLGGDEFVLLFQHEHPEKLIQETIDKLHLIKDSYGKINSEIKMCISVGLIRVNPSQSFSLDLMYRQSDRALYAAKIKSKTEPDKSHIVSRPFLFSNSDAEN